MLRGPEGGRRPTSSGSPWTATTRASTSRRARPRRWSRLDLLVEGQGGDQRTRRLGAPPAAACEVPRLGRRPSCRPSTTSCRAQHHAGPSRTRTSRTRTPSKTRTPTRSPTRSRTRTPSRGVRQPWPATRVRAAVVGSRWRTSGPQPLRRRLREGTPAGRGDPRHRLRRAPLARRGGPHRREARLPARSATSTTRPTPRSGSTSSARSTAAIDPLAGHGTFIAGLIHQACPDADIVAWRIVGADGLVVESNLVKALEDIAELARRHRDGEPGGHPIDVLSLSLGYYHETPDDELFDPTMYGILRRLGECGVAVVCSAGNDATARPVFPAAFTPWLDDAGRRARRARRRADRLGRRPQPQPHDRRAVQQHRHVGPHVRPRSRGDEHHPADVPGRVQRDGQHRGLPAPSASLDRPRRLQQRIRALERDVVLDAVLRRPPGRAAWSTRSTRPTTTARPPSTGLGRQ